MGEASVLIVEDAENWRNTLAMVIQHMGHGVYAAKTLEEARGALGRMRYKLAIVDVRLVEMEPEDTSGLTLVKEASRQKRVDRFILISAHDVAAQVRAEFGDAIEHRFFSKEDASSAGFRELLEEWLGNPGVSGQPLVSPRTLAARDINGLDSPHRNSITWLHLSDLHFSDTDIIDIYNRNVVLKSLLADVAKLVSSPPLLRPDFIAITGDLAYSGQYVQYKPVRRFLDDLLKVTGLPLDRLFLVPGNHDVDRRRVTKGASAIGRSLTERNRVTGVLNSVGDRNLLMARFKEGYDKFVKETFRSSPLYDKKRLFYVRNLELAGQGVAILGLNSAWLSESDQDKAAGLVIGECQVRDALELAGDVELKIALLHHPFNWLRDFDQTDSGDLLLNRCDFILHGHLHRKKIQSLTDPNGSTVVIAGGACYETREHPNLYNFVRFDPVARTGDMYLRQYTDQEGGFWGPGALIYPSTPDGNYQFKLQERNARI